MQTAGTDNKRRVLDATDIVRLVGDHISIKPKGREYVCLCPFHDDRNPSMFVVPHKQIFHCFVCGAGGNAIDFVMRYHAMEFRAALEYLAQRAGVSLETLAPRAADAKHSGASTKEQLIEANAFAQRIFRTLLAHPRHGEAARAVVDRRGISPEMVERFGIGCAADEWDGLLKTIRSKDQPLQPFLDAGLLKRRPEGEGCYDAMRHRLTFPIFDQIGRVVAFGGRRLREEDEPKYLNSSESAVFDKGATLFGLPQAQRAIQAERCAIVTEGYTDVVACHQHGVEHVVATLGTALTARHAAILRRLCDTVVLLFDGDEAGMKAADRALEVVFAEPIDIRVAVLPGGADPDDLLKQECGGEAFRSVVEGSTDFLVFRFSRLRARLDESGVRPRTAARARAIEDEIDRLVQLGLRRLSPVQQQTVVSRLSSLAGVDAQTIAEALTRAGVVRGGRANPSSGMGVERPSTRRSAAEEALGCLLCDAALAETDPDAVEDIVQEGAYGSPLLEQVARAVSAVLAGDRQPTLNNVMDELDDAPARSAATALALEIDRKAGGDHATIARHWTECVRRHRMEHAREPDIGGQIATADLDRLHEALERRRRAHEQFGGDPLAMPRPRGAATGKAERNDFNAARSAAVGGE